MGGGLKDGLLGAVRCGAAKAWEAGGIALFFSGAKLHFSKARRGLG